MSLSIAVLLLSLVGLNSGQITLSNCDQVPGELVQLDAGNGQVFGVDRADNIYTLYHDKWTQIPGSMKHISVGAAGIWGTNRNNNIYRMAGGTWVQVNGLLKQLDAGGAPFISGVNSNDDIFCLDNDATVSMKSNAVLPWKHIVGKLKYISCGPQSCWGTNSADDIYFRSGVTANSCSGSSWQNIPGKLVMTNVGSDSSVYGVNSGGDVYRRDGISNSNPIGTAWTRIQYNNLKFKQVCHDLDKLWLVTTCGKIMRCSV